ncbi:MAG: S8 family serine peptidase [Myxococcota bacterium]
MRGLQQLLDDAAGRRSHSIGLVDGPVDTTHPGLSRSRIRGSERAEMACTSPSSPACHHGTFVAGQLSGLSPMSELVAHPLFCEASDLGRCPVVRPSHLADAINGLMDRGVRIINMSVGLQGGPAGSLSTLHRAYRRAEKEGVLLVAAAGNDGHNDANPLFRDPWVIPVAAHDPAGRVLPSSNRGGMVARYGLSAPGEDIVGLAPGGGKTRMSGTSVAAPMVASAAALLWSLFPQATAAEIHHALRRPEFGRSGDLPPSLDLVDSHQWLSRRFPRSTANPKRSTMMQHLPIPATPPTAGHPPSSASSVVPQGYLVPQGIAPQACGCDPGPAAGFVYSTGTLDPRFPDEGDKKEFTSRAREQGVAPDNFYAVLSQRDNRFLARRICWALVVNERPAGILVPRSELELNDLIEALNPDLQPDPELAVTGTLGSTAPAEKCDGLEVPMVAIADLSYFTKDQLIKQLHDQVHLPAGATSSDLDTAIQRIWTLLGIWREPGFNDEQRAKNYVALRTTNIYETTVQLSLPSSGAFWLQSATASSDQTEAGRSIVNVDFAYQNASGQTQTWRAEIDVTNLFAFQSKALFAV